MSDVIFKVSIKYNVPANLFTAILMQESSYDLNAANVDCGHVADPVLNVEVKTCVQQDLGIAQINHKTVASYGFDPHLISTDMEYSVDAGAQVLAWFKKTYAKKESQWWTRYNCGSKPDVTRKTCQEYARLVSRWL